jgi:hypothetical protein
VDFPIENFTRGYSKIGSWLRIFQPPIYLADLAGRPSPRDRAFVCMCFFEHIHQIWWLIQRLMFWKHVFNDVLVGGLKHFLFFHILGTIITTDFHSYQRGRYTTNQPNLMVHRCFHRDFHDPPKVMEGFPLFEAHPCGCHVLGMVINFLVMKKGRLRRLRSLLWSHHWKRTSPGIHMGVFDRGISLKWRHFEAGKNDGIIGYPMMSMFLECVKDVKLL